MRATLHSTTFRLAAAAAAVAALLLAALAALMAPAPQSVQAQQDADEIAPFQFLSPDTVALLSGETSTALALDRNNGTASGGVDANGNIRLTVHLVAERPTGTLGNTPPTIPALVPLPPEVGTFTLSGARRAISGGTEPSEISYTHDANGHLTSFSFDVDSNPRRFEIVFTRGAGNGIADPEEYRAFLLLADNDDSVFDPPFESHPELVVADETLAEVGVVQFSSTIPGTPIPLLLESGTALNLEQGGGVILRVRLLNGVTSTEDVRVNFIPQGFGRTALGASVLEFQTGAGASTSTVDILAGEFEAETGVTDVSRDMHRGPPRSGSITVEAYFPSAPGLLSVRPLVSSIPVTVEDTEAPQYALRLADGMDLPIEPRLTEGVIDTEFSVRSVNSVTVHGDVRIGLSASSMTGPVRLATPGQEAGTEIFFEVASGTVNTAAFMFGVEDDNIYHGVRSIEVEVSTATTIGSRLVSHRDHFFTQGRTLTVTDNDRPRLQAAAVGQSGDEVEFRVELAEGSPSLGVDLPVTIEVGAPQGLFAGTLPTDVTILSGQESATVMLTLASDGAFGAAPGDVMLTVQSGPNYDVAGGAARIANVADPDRPAVVIGNAGAVTLEREGGTQPLVVRLAGSSVSLDAALAVGLDVDDPSGTLSLVGGGDLPASVVIPSGQSSTTLTLQIVDDTTYEGGGNQVATVRLQASAAYEVSPTTTTLMLTVPDDDTPSVRPPPVGDPAAGRGGAASGGGGGHAGAGGAGGAGADADAADELP